MRELLRELGLASGKQARHQDSTELRIAAVSAMVRLYSSALPWQLATIDGLSECL
jgi:hypothetical protein